MGGINSRAGEGSFSAAHLFDRTWACGSAILDHQARVQARTSKGSAATYGQNNLSPLFVEREGRIARRLPSLADQLNGGSLFRWSFEPSRAPLGEGNSHVRAPH